ncbi:MAG: class I SAM-dependent methyltransferase, partial [Actinomycetota bacterium]
MKQSRVLILPRTCGDLRIRGRLEEDLDADLVRGADPERLPYWSVLWHSATALAGHMIQQQRWRGLEVLELGCGPGAAGLALAAAGARVTQTDLFPEAVTLARANACANGINACRHAAADWRAWPFRALWPVIIGSDLTYERASHPALLSVLEQALAPDGVAYLADPGRP